MTFSPQNISSPSSCDLELVDFSKTSEAKNNTLDEVDELMVKLFPWSEE